MKLSLKARDEQQHQNPLFRAKIPITIVGFPFISGIIAGDSSDLSFNLSTNFPTGPSLKLSYTPNSTTSTTSATSSAATSATTPFSLSLKSGVGLFGSPHNSPLIISAHFNLFSNPNPSFSLQIKPQFGDFSLRKTTHSNPNPKSSNGSHLDGGIGDGFVPETPMVWTDLAMESCDGKDGFPNRNPIANAGIGFAPERPLVWRDLKIDSCNGKDGIFSGVAVRARTALPVTSRLAVNFRWGLNLPSDLGKKLPFLTVDKVGIERVGEVKEVNKKSFESDVGDLELLKGMCFWMRRDLEVLQKENREMKQYLEEMRLGVTARNRHSENGGVGKNALPTYVENSGYFEKWRSKKSGGEENGRRETKKSVNRVSNVESELQKAIKAVSS
ncbi:hypothetical protein L1049_027115 [Liquidambar formosana]|uniref:Uncharacterized protein n=1 Tax=Liquidambar formosana TaxID=63359 RepID=A0AAP0N7P5_LIQFO